MAQTKICTKCGQEKPATAEYFHKRKDARDGLVGQCINCVQERRAKNRDSNREACRRYRNKNIEKARAREREYGRKNREAKKEYNKKYYAANKELLNQKYKEYREKNKDRLKIMQREYQRRYCQAPRTKELKRIWFHEYKSKKSKLPATLTVKQWQACKDRFNHSCAYCGKSSKRLQQEHFIPVDSGGSYTVNNIVPACKFCNSSKLNRDFFVWYPAQPFYSKLREKRILKYLKYDGRGQQQGSILEQIREEA